MKPEYINAFIQSVTETFDDMLDCQVNAREPAPAAETGETDSLIGIIGLSGTAQGTVAVKFPIETAISLIGDWVGIKYFEIDTAVVDGVGELINIIAGNAKVKLKNHKISISLPTVLRGGIHRLTSASIESLKVPFESNRGEFEIIVSFRPTVMDEEEIAHEGAHSR